MRDFARRTDLERADFTGIPSGVRVARNPSYSLAELVSGLATISSRVSLKFLRFVLELQDLNHVCRLDCPTRFDANAEPSLLLRLA